MVSPSLPLSLPLFLLLLREISTTIRSGEIIAHLRASERADRGPFEVRSFERRPQIHSDPFNPAFRTFPFLLGAAAAAAAHLFVTEAERLSLAPVL